MGNKCVRVICKPPQRKSGQDPSSVIPELRGSNSINATFATRTWGSCSAGEEDLLFLAEFSVDRLQERPAVLLPMEGSMSMEYLAKTNTLLNCHS